MASKLYKFDRNDSRNQNEEILQDDIRGYDISNAKRLKQKKVTKFKREREDYTQQQLITFQMCQSENCPLNLPKTSRVCHT